MCVTFLSIVDVVRGSHVTTVDGGRFCGADDNVGGFGNVLVTGRHTHANILNAFFSIFFTEFHNFIYCCLVRLLDLSDSISSTSVFAWCCLSTLLNWVLIFDPNLLLIHILLILYKYNAECVCVC